MPLAPTAPWIIPPDYTGAMARGAQLGLSARNQDREEKSAADRLKLAYDQLDRHEKIASANAAEKLAFETKKLDLMGEYNKQRLEAQAAKVKPIAEPKPFHISQGSLVDPTGKVLFDSNKGKLSEIDKFGIQAAHNEIKALQLKLADTNPKNPTHDEISKRINELNIYLEDMQRKYAPQSGAASETATATPAVAALTAGAVTPETAPAAPTEAADVSAAAALKAQAAAGMALPQGHGIPPGPFQRGYVPPGAALPSAPTAPSKVTTKEQYDALEPGAIYIGKDGKRYRKPQSA